MASVGWAGLSFAWAKTPTFLFGIVRRKARSCVRPHQQKEGDANQCIPLQKRHGRSLPIEGP
jgi:hypothetical protein